MREGIVATVEARYDFVCLVCRVVGQGVDVGSQARGGGRIDSSDMVVDTCLLCARLDALLD